MAEQTVREQMADALQDVVADAIGYLDAGNRHERTTYRASLIHSLSRSQTALIRHRANPECACDGPECPGYERGLEAQRERVS